MEKSRKVLSWDNQDVTNEKFAEKVASTSFKDLSCLTAVGNALKEFPSLVGLEGLEVLDLSKNTIRAVHIPKGGRPGGERRERLQRLQRLHMTENKLTVFDVDPRTFENVTDLGLSKNCLKEFPPCIFGMRSLRRLDLQENVIGAIPFGLGKLKHLRRIFFGGNLITGIADDVSGLPLERLDLRKNRLQFLPPSIWALPANVLRIEGNPLKMVVPDDVRAGGEFSIMLTLQKQFLQKVRWPFVKLLVVGEEGVGKTSLLRRLGKDQVHDGMSTDGVQVRPLKLGGSEDVQFNAYDFGGQEVFYPTHMFFMSCRAVFVVVFNAVEGSDTNRAEYWVAKVRNFTAGTYPPPAILMVGTHCKSGACSAGKCEAWAAKLKVKHMILVDNKVNFGFEALAETLTKVSKGLVERKCPSYYSVVADALDGLRSVSFLWKWENFRALSACFSVPKEDWVTMTRFMHDAGLLIFLEQKNLKDSLVVLSPQWLADRMSDIISFKHSWAKGVVPKSVLSFIWNKQDIDADVQTNLLEAFVRLGIFFRRGGTGEEFIAPCMLPLECQGMKPTVKSAFGRDYMMNVLPVGLFGRLQVRIVSEPGVVVHEIWRNGLFFSLGGEKALVEARDGGLGAKGNVARVEIRAGPGSRLLPLVVEALDTLIKSVFNRFEQDVQRVAVCSHCLMARAPEPTLFSLEACGLAIKKGALYMDCGGEGVAVALQDLVPDIMMQHMPLVLGLTLDKLLGQGGFGAVYRGTLADGTVVAVKEMSKDHTADVEESFRELRHEVSIISTLRSDFLVRFIGITTDPIRVVMEFCPLPDLYKHLHDVSLLPEEQFDVRLRLKFGLDISRAMTYLHAQVPRIVHRDLRSPNVFVVSTDPTAVIHAKVGDFGLAVHVTTAVSESLGTWQWLAPEILSGKDYDEKVDVYSFGVVLWEIFSRKFPFDEYDQFITIVTQWTEYLPDGSAVSKTGRKEIWKEQQIRAAIVGQNLRPTIPVCKCASLIRNCWSADPASRPDFVSITSSIGDLLGMKIEVAESSAMGRSSSSVVAVTLCSFDFDAVYFGPVGLCFFVLGCVEGGSRKSSRFSPRLSLSSRKKSPRSMTMGAAPRLSFGKSSSQSVLPVAENGAKGVLERKGSLGASLSLLSRSDDSSGDRDDLSEGCGILQLFDAKWTLILDESKTISKEAICCVCIIDEETFLCGGELGLVMVFKVSGKNAVQMHSKWKCHNTRVKGLCVARGNIVYTCDDSGQIKSWDLMSKKLLYCVEVKVSVLSMCAWEAVIVVVGTTGTVFVLDDGKVRHMDTFAAGPITAACIVGDEFWCSTIAGINVYDLNKLSFQILAKLGAGDGVNVLVCGNGLGRSLLVLSGSKTGSVCCWSASSRAVVWEANVGAPVRSIVHSQEVLVLTEAKKIVGLLVGN